MPGLSVLLKINHVQMKLSPIRCFFPQWSWLYLAMLLGVYGTALATPLSKKPQKGKTAQYRLKKQTGKTKKGNRPPQKEPTATPSTKPPKPAPLKKPKPLEPASITPEDPWVRLDTLVVKQHIFYPPYVPWVQTIGVAVDYGRLSMNLWRRKERRYAGTLSILFRKNVQLSGTLGHQDIGQERSMGNKSGYTVVGYYGNLGLDYFVFYNPRNNLYAGLRYGGSFFQGSTTPVSPLGQVISKDLTASWWELVIGSEHQLFSDLGLYAGFVIHLKKLNSSKKFEPAANYIVPGYGRNVQNIVPAITLYIQYQISFLRKQITFN